MFYGIDVDVITVPLKVVLVPQRVFPVSPLPAAAFTFSFPAYRASLAHRDTAGKYRLEQAPARCRVRIAQRQGPNRVQMIRQHDNGVEHKRMFRPHVAKRFAQEIDLFHKQMRAAVGEIDGEKEAPAGYKVTPVVGHSNMIDNGGGRSQMTKRSLGAKTMGIVSLNSY